MGPTTRRNARLSTPTLRPHPVDIKLKGNSMTQKYYCDNILPFYIDAVTRHKTEQPEKPWKLLEDGDSSHCIIRRGLTRQIKDEAGIENFPQPSNSPDLNAKEGILNMLKCRVRQRVWNTTKDMKEVIQDEWHKITQDEIRKYIDELPDRYYKVCQARGHPIRTDLW